MVKNAVCENDFYGRYFPKICPYRLEEKHLSLISLIGTNMKWLRSL